MAPDIAIEIIMRLPICQSLPVNLPRPLHRSTLCTHRCLPCNLQEGHKCGNIPANYSTSTIERGLYHFSRNPPLGTGLII